MLYEVITIEAADPRYRPFADRVRQMASDFQFEAIMSLISQDADL